MSIKDKNGNEVNQETNQVPKIMLIAVDQYEIPILTKLIAIGDLTITPTFQVRIEVVKNVFYMKDQVY